MLKNNTQMIISLVVGVIILFGVIFIMLNSNQEIQDEQNSERDVATQEAQEDKQLLFEFAEIEHDFGIIKQSGGIVQHKFLFTYNGSETISVTGVPTSCACTSADIDREELKQGDTAIITVSFDPNLHAEPEGRFFKSITLMTDPATENAPELKIWAEIDLDLGSDAYKLKNHNN